MNKNKVFDPVGLLIRVQHGIETRLGQHFRSERGDVPGWILITLMTSGLVILIWALAGPALADIFDQAVRRVTGSVR